MIRQCVAGGQDCHSQASRPRGRGRTSCGGVATDSKGKPPALPAGSPLCTWGPRPAALCPQPAQGVPRSAPREGFASLASAPSPGSAPSSRSPRPARHPPGGCSSSTAGRGRPGRGGEQCRRHGAAPLPVPKDGPRCRRRWLAHAHWGRGAAPCQRVGEAAVAPRSRSGPARPTAERSTEKPTVCCRAERQEGAVNTARYLRSAASLSPGLC